MPEQTDKIAVVILNWNGEHFLKKFLPSVIKYSDREDTTVIIADNGSTDNSVSYLKANYPDVRLILFDTNYGFTEGYNKALEQINTEYYILLNSDIEVSRRWIEPIITMMDNDKQIAAAMPKIRSYANRSFFEYAGACGGYIDKFGYPFCRGRIIGTIEEDIEQYNNLSDVFWASGAAMFVRAEHFHKAGGFDNDFFAHMEEIDLCWRLKNLGYKIVINPESNVFHVGGGTLPNDSPGKIYLNYRNNLFLLLKNLPTNKIIPIIFSRLILDGLSGFIYFVSLKFGFFFAVLKAHFHFYLRIRKTLKKRDNKINKNIRHKEIYPKSIVYNYFVKKKHSFNKLEF